MKKFFITLLILIILGGAGFIYGWAQFFVPPGQYGVISSKTHGIDPYIVRSGEFRWVWFKLIPTNVKIAVFNLDQQVFPVSFKSSLPSGDTYASFVGLSNPDFSWDLQGEIRFSIKPEMLITLTDTYKLGGEEDFNNYLQTVSKEIEVIILRSLSNIEPDSDRLEQLMSGNPDQQMIQEIRGRFPELNDFSFIIHSAKYPDFILYRQIRLLYEEFFAKQREVISTSFGRRADSHIAAQLRLQELEQYGDLFTRFPILLDYLALQNGDR